MHGGAREREAIFLLWVTLRNCSAGHSPCCTSWASSSNSQKGLPTKITFAGGSSCWSNVLNSLLSSAAGSLAFLELFLELPSIKSVNALISFDILGCPKGQLRRDRGEVSVACYRTLFSKGRPRNAGLFDPLQHLDKGQGGIQETGEGRGDRVLAQPTWDSCLKQ